MISLRQDRFEEAEAYAREALALDGKSAYAEDVLGLAYAKQERMAEALQALGRAISLAPKEKFIRDHYLQVRKIYIDNAGRNRDNRNGMIK
jgi:Flp pilus assembly protein TadD